MGYSKEEQFLFKASKLSTRSFSPKKNDYDLNIDTLMSLSKTNLLLPFLYSRLIKFPEFKKKISVYENLFHSIKINGLARQMEYDYLYKECEKYSLEFIPLKGSILSRILYKEPALREMIDIDIFAKYEDSQRWHDFFIQSGYVQVRSEKGIKDNILPLLKEKDIRKHVDDVKLVRENSVIEVHFRLLSLKISDQLTNEEIWENSQFENVSGLKTRVLCPEHHLINLTTHCAYHNFGFGLRSIAEIDGLINHYKKRLNWEIFFATAESSNLLKLVYIPIYLARSFYNSPIPDGLICKIESKSGSFWKKLALKIEQDYFNRHEIPILQDSSLFLQILSQQSWLKSIIRVFMPSKKYMELKSESSKKGFFFILSQYTLRFIHLFRRFFIKILKSMFKTYKILYGRNSKTDKL